MFARHSSHYINFNGNLTYGFLVFFLFSGSLFLGELPSNLKLLFMVACIFSLEYFHVNLFFFFLSKGNMLGCWI